MNALSASGLADLAGTTEAEVQRLVDLGVLVARDGAGPFRATDVQKVRLATACEQAGLPMAGIAAAIRAGRLSFAFLEAAPYRRWAVRSTRTYRQVSQETGVPLEHARQRPGVDGVRPDGARRADPGGRAGDRAVAAAGPVHRDPGPGLADPARPGLRRGPAAGRQGRERGLPGAVQGPVRASGADQQTAMELAAQLGSRLPAAGGPGADGHLPPPAGAGVDRGPGRGHRGRAGAGRRAGAARAGPGDVRSWTWSATPASPRSTATRPPPRWPRPWPCWSAGPRASTAGCR